MNSWRRLLVVLLSVALIGVACSSRENVSTDGQELSDAESDALADVEWLFGTAWTVLSSDGEPIDTPVTLTFSRRDGELLLDVIDDCGSTARLTPFAGVYDVQPISGDDCLSPTNVRDQLVHEVGQLRLDRGSDGLLLIRTAGDVLIVAEHFQSTSIQTDVALKPEPETEVGPSETKPVIAIAV